MAWNNDATSGGGGTTAIGYLYLGFPMIMHRSVPLGVVRPMVFLMCSGTCANDVEKVREAGRSSRWRADMIFITGFGTLNTRHRAHFLLIGYRLLGDSY